MGENQNTQTVTFCNCFPYNSVQNNTNTTYVIVYFLAPNNSTLCASRLIHVMSLTELNMLLVVSREKIKIQHVSNELSDTFHDMLHKY